MEAQSEDLVLRSQSSSPSRTRSSSPAPAPPATKTGFTLGKPTRTVDILNEDQSERITIGAAYNTKSEEVKELLCNWLGLKTDKVRLLMKQGAYIREPLVDADVPSRVIALGIQSFKRQAHRYKHPILIIGAGMGGLQTMISFLKRGRKDFVCLEKLSEFGGNSWLRCANKYTQLQTEKGTYHLDYVDRDAKVPHYIGDMKYTTWPSREQLLKMFHQQAMDRGLDEYMRFNTSLEKTKVMGTGLHDRAFACQTVPVDSDEGGELIMAGAIVAWPGNLCKLNKIEFPGESEFGGYIEYSSFGLMDYSTAAGKEVVLYGHGAFTIENVRTLVEHRVKKVTVMCRRRNICGMKMASWLVGYMEAPVPGHLLLEIMQRMYGLVGVDIWDFYSVKTDATKSYAHVSQKTVFGVTDVYFLAGYFGLMEVIEDEIKKLTHHTAHTTKGKKVPCEMIIKAVGTVPDFKIDKELALKELWGLWAHGDPMRPICCNAMFVEARNFGTFSSGPGFASMVHMFSWFIDYPEDLDLCKNDVPKRRADDRPCYVPTATHMLPTIMAVMNAVPLLGAEMSAFDAMKWQKQQQAHPMPQYLAEAKGQWEMYCKMFRDAGQVTEDQIDPPYPYTEELMTGYMHSTNRYWRDLAEKKR